jgi:hypothetical protein
MLANLPQLPAWLWMVVITTIIIVIATFLVWWRKRKFIVTKIEVPLAGAKVTLEPPKTSEPPETSKQASINISRNNLFGRTKIHVRRADSNISDNTTFGETDITIGAKPGPKPKEKKGTRRK